MPRFVVAIRIQGIILFMLSVIIWFFAYSFLPDRPGLDNLNVVISSYIGIILSGVTGFVGVGLLLVADGLNAMSDRVDVLERRSPSPPDQARQE